MPAQVKTASLSPTQSLDSVYQPVLNALDRLFRQVNVGRSGEIDFENALFLLETLPLASADFGTARLRLNNANRYRMSNDNGAAAWEVRTLMLQLRANLSAEASNPRRRLIRRNS